jgi:hypothetical protein
MAVPAPGTSAALKENPMRSLCAAMLALALCTAVPAAHADPLGHQGHRTVELRQARQRHEAKRGAQPHAQRAAVLLDPGLPEYLSAANIYLLNEYTNYINLDGATDAKMIKLVYDFCKANPDKTPISAIDAFIRDAKKIDVKESEVFDPWEE